MEEGMTVDKMCHPIFERRKADGSYTSVREAEEAKTSNQGICRLLEGIGPSR